MGPQPADAKNTAIDGKLHQRHGEDYHRLRFNKHFIQIMVCPVETLNLIILPHKGFGYPNSRNILLDAGV